MSVGIQPAAAAGGNRVEVLISFDASAKETAENLAVDGDGSVYVSLAYASTVVKRTPDGTLTRVALPSAGGFIAGIALIPGGGGDLAVAVSSPDAQTAGIWRLPRGSFVTGNGATPARIVPLPANGFANGITYDQRGNLYVAESILGRIWRVPQGSRTAEPWIDDPLLRPTGAKDAGNPLPGANGVKVAGETVWVSNTSARTITQIPIQPDGSAGKAVTRFTEVFSDDFTLDVNGNLFVAANQLNQILRVTPNGEITVLATKADDGLDNPTAIALGACGADCAALYVTNAAFTSDDPHPSLLRLRLGS